MVGMKQAGCQRGRKRDRDVLKSADQQEVQGYGNEYGDMGLGQSERAKYNMDVLVRHDGAEIDKQMFKSGGDSGEGRWSDGGSRMDIITG